MPVVFFPKLLLQLISFLLLGLAAWLLWSWWDGYDVMNAHGVAYRVHGPDWRLWTALGLLAWSFGAGRLIVLMLMPAGHAPMHARTAGRTVTAPDGSRLHVETSGPSTGPTLVFTHGWGLDSTAWGDARQALGATYRIVAWDLPGLGLSKAPADGVLTIDRFAQALGAVVEDAGPGPVLLVGHSIGGMTTQTFWRSASETARARVAGLVLVNTTHLNPLRTMWLAGLWTALERPLIRPMIHLSIWLSPLVWLSTWQGYLSGSNHVAVRLTGFGRYATRGQVELTTRLACKGSPGVQGKGDLAMFDWKVTGDLPSVSVPTLVLSGGSDIITTPAASRTIVGSIREARLVENAGCGHMGFMERHDAYTAEIAAFAQETLHTPAATA